MRKKEEGRIELYFEIERKFKPKGVTMADLGA